jgi:hypothetical protein
MRSRYSQTKSERKKKKWRKRGGKTVDVRMIKKVVKEQKSY